MKKHKNIAGQKFGRLTAIKRNGKDNQDLTLWLCKCECGNKITTRLSNLTTGATKSCGCLQKDIVTDMKTKHGLSVNDQGEAPRLYSIWRNMKQRCNNPNASKYKNYGGKGISFCEEWENYKPFHDWAINNGYSDDLTLDRIDNNGDYCPENCRWVTYRQQNLNSSQNHLVTFKGETKTITEWSEILNIKRTTLYSRISKYGWSIKKSFTTPVRGHKNEENPAERIKY